jgi:hypothetical protein
VAFPYIGLFPEEKLSLMAMFAPSAVLKDSQAYDNQKGHL